ncbi:hypothetical protein [Demetria terragena]|uniref:hypothetical protein n=1 Tax=Demetria terragena TaxID=63959 RepID=UPI0012EA3559|nr:hypothetical protein [Demetria terragena]
MTNYLMYDDGCTLCSDIAERVEGASEGWLTVRPIGDSEVTELLRNSGEVAPNRPHLVVVDGGEGAQLLSGASMSWAMIQGMGIRRALSVSGIVHDALKKDARDGRRSFLRAAGLGVGVATGMALGASPSMAAGGSADAGALDPDGLSELQKRARGNPQFKAALQTARSQGFDTKLSKSVGFDTGDGGRLLYVFIGHAERGDREAAVLSFHLEGGVEKVSLESVEGDIDEVVSASRVGDVLNVRSVALASSLAPMGKMDYFKCVVFCVGANCASKAAKCAKLRFMYLVLACMVAVCGSKVKTCHKVCKSKW